MHAKRRENTIDPRESTVYNRNQTASLAFNSIFIEERKIFLPHAIKRGKMTNPIKKALWNKNQTIFVGEAAEGK